MATKRAKTEFYEGKKFDNFSDFNHAFDQFQKKYGLNLRLQSSCYIVDVLPKEGKKFNDDLMFYKLDFLCKEGYMKGINGKPHFAECTYKVNIRTTEDGQQLFVKFMDNLAVHNHKIKKPFKQFVPTANDPNVAFNQTSMEIHPPQSPAICSNISSHDRVNGVASSSHLPALPASLQLPVSPAKVAEVDGGAVETKTTRQKRQAKQDDVFVYQPVKKRCNRRTLPNTTNSSITKSKTQNVPTPTRKSRRQMEKKAAVEAEIQPETPTTNQVDTASVLSAVSYSADGDHPPALHGWENVEMKYRSRPRPTRVNPGKLRQASAFISQNVSFVGDDSSKVRSSDEHLSNTIADVPQALAPIGCDFFADQPIVKKLKLRKKMESKGLQCSLTTTTATTTATTTDMSTQTDSTFTSPVESQQMDELFVKVLTERLRAQGSTQAAFNKFLVLGKMIQLKQAANLAQK